MPGAPVKSYLCHCILIINIKKAVEVVCSFLASSALRDGAFSFVVYISVLTVLQGMCSGIFKNKMMENDALLTKQLGMLVQNC